MSATKTPPLVPGLPLIGNALGLMSGPTEFFLKAYRQYGPVFRVRIPTALQPEMVVMAGPDANVFASREGEKYFTTKEYFKHLTRETGTPNYMCALEGETHRHFRKELRPAFSREFLTPYVPVMLTRIREVTQTLPVNEPISAMDMLQRLTIDLLALTTSNCPIHDDQFHDLGVYAKTFVGAGVAMQPSLLFHNPAYKAAKQRFEHYLEELLDGHRTHQPGSERQPDLIDVVLQATYANGEAFNIADQVAHAHLPYVNGLIYAGRICGYMLYALLKNPTLMQRVTDEIDEAYARGEPDMNALRTLKLLRATMLESIRFYPIAVAAPRYAAQSFEYKGYHIPADSMIFVVIALPHLMEEVYPEPHKFEPERFLPPRNEHQRPGAFNPYGLGTHTCISIGLVETVVAVTMLGLLRDLRMTLAPPSYELKTILNPVPGPDSKFKLRVSEVRQHTLSRTHQQPDQHENPVQPSIELDSAHQLLANLWSKAIPQTYQAGTAIIRQGEVADAFYVLVQGEVDIIKEIQGQLPEVVKRLYSGSYFGEIGLLQRINRTATAIASNGKVEVLRLDQQVFLDLVEKYDLTSAEIAGLLFRHALSLQLAVALPTLNLEQIAKALPRATTLRFPQGSTVIEQGALADKFYIISKGQAEVVQFTADEHCTVLAIMKEGNYFGEIGLLQSRPRTATVRALTDLSVIAISRDEFLRMIEKSPQTNEMLALTLMKRLRDEIQLTI